MLKLLQKSMAMQIALILVATTLLWIRPLLAPPTMEAGTHPAILYGILCQWLSAVPRLAVIVAMLLVLAEGVLLNLMLSEVSLVSQNNLLPTLLFVVVMSAGATTLTPLILVCGFMIAGLSQLLLHSSLLTIPPLKICNATALIGLATLFYTPAIALLLSYLLVASNYSLYGWKEWFQMILGFLVPYLPVLAVLFFTDGVADWWQGVVETLGTITLAIAFTNLRQTIGMIVLLLLTAGFLFVTITRQSEHPVVWQKNSATVMLYTVSGVGMAVYHGLGGNTMQLFAIPFAFCASRCLLSSHHSSTFQSRKQRQWIYDLLFLTILIAAALC